MTCRLCLLKSLNQIEIFGGSGIQIQIASIIAEHFWFQITEDDPISNCICTICWRKIHDFHIFYLTIKEAQKTLAIKSISTSTAISSQAVSIKNEIEEYLIQQFTESNTVCESEDLKETNTFGSDRGPATQVKEDSDKSDLKRETEDNSGLTLDRIRMESFPKKHTEVKFNNDIKQITTSQDRTPKQLKIDTQLNHSENDDDCSSDYREEENKQSSDSEMFKTYKKAGKKKKTYEKSEKIKLDNEKISEMVKLECDWCGFKGKTFACIKKHCRTEHQKEGFIMCCQKKFFEKRHLLEHINLHLKPEDFKCSICGSTFLYKRNLKKHMAEHDILKQPKKCSKCPKEFTTQRSLNQHELVHVPIEQRKYFCELCNKYFVTKKKLEAHKNLTHEKKYCRICDICGKEIRGKTLFTLHQKEHAGIANPKLQCVDCGKWYKGKHTLRGHRRKVHEEALSEFPCDICGTVKPSRESLRRHKKNKHILLDDLKCSICGRVLNKPTALKEHMTTHTGETLYTCPYCPKTFNFSSSLHLHRKTAHPKEWKEFRERNSGRLEKKD